MGTPQLVAKSDITGGLGTSSAAGIQSESSLVGDLALELMASCKHQVVSVRTELERRSPRGPRTKAGATSACLGFQFLLLDGTKMTQ